MSAILKINKCGLTLEEKRRLKALIATNVDFKNQIVEDDEIDDDLLRIYLTALSGVECLIEFEKVPYRIAFHQTDNLNGKIISVLRAANSKIPRELKLELYQVVDFKDAAISDLKDLVAGQTYTFTIPSYFPPTTANQWTLNHVNELLKIQFNDGYDFMGEHKLSLHAEAVIQELSDVNASVLDLYQTESLTPAELNKFRGSNPGLKSALKKSMFAADKFTNNEATVDAFLRQLLFKLGYFEQWLLLIPQLAFQVEYSSCIKDAVCDLCIVDIVSVALMVVAVDKNVDSERINTEGQLFANIIAAVMQVMSRKRKSPEDEGFLTPAERTMYGLRLNGLVFHFYEVTVSDSMLQAVGSCRAANVPTKVNCRRGLDFRRRVHREEIVRILDTWRDSMECKGVRSGSV